MPPTNLNLHVCMALKRRVNEHKQSPLLSVPFLGIPIESFTGNHCTTPGPSVSLPLLCCRWFSKGCWLCSDTTGVPVGESTNRETSRPNLFNFVRVLSDVFFRLFSLFFPPKNSAKCLEQSSMLFHVLKEPVRVNTENEMTVAKFSISSYFAQITIIVSCFRKYHSKVLKRSSFFEIEGSLKIAILAA